MPAGDHTFLVRAVDAAGNTDQTPATHTWTVVDAAAPETTIVTAPAAATESTSASAFTFAASEPATFECSLNGAAFAPCASPVSYSGLARGGYTFAVRATDTAGNVDPTPAVYAWTVVDTTAPETGIDLAATTANLWDRDGMDGDDVGLCAAGLGLPRGCIWCSRWSEGLG